MYRSWDVGYIHSERDCLSHSFFFFSKEYQPDGQLAGIQDVTEVRKFEMGIGDIDID